MLAGNLAWFTMAAEDAPERSASRQFHGAVAYDESRGSTLACMLPAIWRLPRDPFAAFGPCGGGDYSARRFVTLESRRGDRKTCGAVSAKPIVNMIEAFSAMGWAALAVCLNGHPA